MHIQNVTDILITKPSCKQHVHIAAPKQAEKIRKMVSIGGVKYVKNRFSLTHFVRTEWIFPLGAPVILMQSGVAPNEAYPIEWIVEKAQKSVV